MHRHRNLPENYSIQRMPNNELAIKKCLAARTENTWQVVPSSRQRFRQRETSDIRHGRCRCEKSSQKEVKYIRGHNSATTRSGSRALSHGTPRAFPKINTLNTTHTNTHERSLRHTGPIHSVALRCSKERLCRDNSVAQYNPAHLAP